jgi:hypothetical protein
MDLLRNLNISGYGVLTISITIVLTNEYRPTTSISTDIVTTERSGH